jgi:hypothetical protein
MEECSSHFHIFYEHEDFECSQDNLIQSRTQESKFKTREQLEKGKRKIQHFGAIKTTTSC